MTIEMLVIVASLIFGLTVIVVANVWAVMEPPQPERQRSLSRAIEEILGAANESPTATHPAPPPQDLDGGSDVSAQAVDRRVESRSKRVKKIERRPT